MKIATRVSSMSTLVVRCADTAIPTSDVGSVSTSGVEDHVLTCRPRGRRRHVLPYPRAKSANRRIPVRGSTGAPRCWQEVDRSVSGSCQRAMPGCAVV